MLLLARVRRTARQGLSVLSRVITDCHGPGHGRSVLIAMARRMATQGSFFTELCLAACHDPSHGPSGAFLY